MTFTDDNATPHPQPGTTCVNLWRIARAASSAAGLTPQQRLVLHHLITYADHDTGRRIFPGVERLARECATDVRNMRRALAALVKSGWLYVVRAGGGRGKATEYGVRMGERTAETGASSTPDDHPETGVEDAGKGGNSCTETGVENAPPSLTISHDLSSRPGGRTASPPRRRGKDEEEKPRTTPTTVGGGLGAVLAAFPARMRHGHARTRAADAYTARIASGATPDRITAELAARPPRAGEWPDAWLARQGQPSTPTPHRAWEVCPDCHDSGWVEDQHGNPVARCTHPHRATHVGLAA